MSSRNQRIRLGIFVLFTTLLFASLIIMFGSLPTFFQRSTLYTIRFTDAPGLGAGAPVRRSGVRIGEVRDIALDEENDVVRVRIAIRPPYSIRKNDQATLITGLLGSDSSIDFMPKSVDPGEPVDRSPYQPGDEIPGVRAATVGTLLKGASEVVPTTQETLADIRKSIQRLEKLAARVEKSVPLAEDTMRAYRDLARRTQNSIPELEKTNSQAQEFLRGAREILPEIQRTAEQYRQLGKNADQALPEILKTNKEIADLARGIKEALPTAERTAEEIRDLVSDVRKMRPKFEGVLDDVGATARQATKLMEEFDVFWQSNREKVSETLTSLKRTFEQASKLISDDNINKVNATLTNLRTASDSFPKISRNAEDISEQGKTTVRRLNSSLEKLDKPLSDLPALLSDIQKFVNNANASLGDINKLTRPLGESSERITRNVDEAAQKLNDTLGDIRALMRTIDKSNGLLQKILTDPSLYNNLDAAAVMVVKMIPRFDRILKDFEIFADKLARHPESLGLGGVVRPGNGLKNPPTPPINTQPQPPLLHTPYSPRK